MKPHVLIIGNLGNMGRRYSAICNYMNYNWSGFDTKIESCIEFSKTMHRFTHAIIASSTDNHVEQILEILNLDKNIKILCEKPISKDINKIGIVCDAVEAAKGSLAMVNQYRYVAPWGPQHEGGETFYRYYKTGTDGLVWDTMNILGLASKGFEIDGRPPIWECQINGIRTGLSMMDQAYIDMIYGWISKEDQLGGLDYILETHLLVDCLAKIVPENARQFSGAIIDGKVEVKSWR